MTHLVKERDYQKTCQQLLTAGEGAAQGPVGKADLMMKVETRLVSAAWVLRRLPDRESGFRHMRTMLWPESVAEAGTYPALDVSSFEARRRLQISAKEIDEMQPALDLLQLLPDVADRRLLFWACWHQDGEIQARLPWAKVRRSMGVSLSRWTMKRRYESSLRWLAALIVLQA